MPDLYFIENGRRRRAEEAKCIPCNKVFLRRFGGDKKCCSRECAGQLRRERVFFICSTCKKTFERVPSRKGRSKHGYYFCSRGCKEQAQSLDGNCPEIRPDHYGKAKGRRSVRKKIFKKRGAVCCDCGEPKKYLITVHHIDGNGSNNKNENLEVLCANCHVKRHLKEIDGEWSYDTRSLTPRDMLEKL